MITRLASDQWELLRGWDYQFITFRYGGRSSSRRIGTEGELIKIRLKIRYFIIFGCFGKFLDEILLKAETIRLIRARNALSLTTLS
jgi:hypothetical protein